MRCQDLTYAQFRESSRATGSAGNRVITRRYLFVSIEFYETARRRPNAREGRPVRLRGQSGQLFNKVIHMRCG
ncbi:conserved hypothetical protein [Burkholderia vietnamiensis]|nr:conserved hypothetical protein [Burkholderia vietnamiensis]